nr:hypothetical protein [Tanacetum cinerariifolium]
WLLTGTKEKKGVVMMAVGVGCGGKWRRQRLLAVEWCGGAVVVVVPAAIGQRQLLV